MPLSLEALRWCFKSWFKASNFDPTPLKLLAEDHPRSLVIPYLLLSVTSPKPGSKPFSKPFSKPLPLPLPFAGVSSHSPWAKGHVSWSKRRQPIDEASTSAKHKMFGFWIPHFWQSHAADAQCQKIDKLIGPEVCKIHFAESICTSDSSQLNCMLDPGTTLSPSCHLGLGLGVLQPMGFGWFCDGRSIISFQIASQEFLIVVFQAT